MNDEVYYQDLYWNDHPRTIAYLSRQIDKSGLGEKRWWHTFFKETYLKSAPAKCALILNCGNGWVERDLFEKGLFQTAVAFDVSEDFVKEAAQAAKDLPIKYLCADCNAVEFEENSFDLVVNVAAMHHVQHIDRMQRSIAKWLVADGMFLNFDYIGPHRNQYTDEHFSLLEEINQLLPVGFRKDPLNRPGIHGIIADDPTEAIHSELILPIFDRYFYPLERKMLGGGIAYPLMHNNPQLYWENDIAQRCVEFLMEMDEIHCVSKKVPPLFAFFVGVPRKELFIESNRNILLEYEVEEMERERIAALNGGLYYS